MSIPDVNSAGLKTRHYSEKAVTGGAKPTRLHKKGRNNTTKRTAKNGCATKKKDAEPGLPVKATGMEKAVLVVPWGRVYCQDPAPKVPGAASRSRFEFVAEGETARGRRGRQDDDACFAHRIGQAERVTDRLP